MTTGLLDLLRAFEPATRWMESSIEVAARSRAEPTADYELVPDNLLLVTVWLEYNVGYTNFAMLDESSSTIDRTANTFKWMTCS